MAGAAGLSPGPEPANPQRSAGMDMHSLELIPSRWLEYEPPSNCHDFGIGSILGTVASIGGTLMQAKSSMDDAAYKTEVARNDAVLLQQKANEDAAAAQRVAITRDRQTDLVLSRSRALAAASGTDAMSPDIMDTEADIATQGRYNALSALYEGQSRARTSNYQAEIDLFKANRIEAAAPWAAGGALLSGVSSLASSRRRDYLLDGLLDGSKKR